ncbi:MAG: histidine phosphatase family protein [Pseudomonadota bacterium]
MTRTLILTRHAKSSWDDPWLADHERPLNKRGRKAAGRIGRWLTERGYIPDQVVSSDAMRTRETLARMDLPTISTKFTRNLYHAGPLAMLDTLSKADGETVLLLGHNPGIADFATRLVTRAPAHSRFLDYPTCATTIIRFDVKGWAGLNWNSGDVLEFVIPRELTA